MNKQIRLEMMKIQANILKIFYQYFKKGGKCLHEFRNHNKEGRTMSMVKSHQNFKMGGQCPHEFWTKNENGRIISHEFLDKE
jgi:hypothetical protein